MTAARLAPRPPPLWLLAFITLNGTLAMHIFVPALPAAARDLHITAGAAQLTTSLYVVGLSLGQLTYGPISDHLGRRPVLMFGMALYTAGSLAALLAPNIGALIVARLFQALGGCSGLVLGRAIVRDGAAGDSAARRLSLMNLMTMLGPGLSPLVGAGLVGLAGWRSVFAAVSLLGLASLTLVWRMLPETGSAPGNAGGVLRNYLSLMVTRRFVAYAIGGGCASASIYAFIAGAPFIFADRLHRPPSEIGVFLAVNIVGLWLGNFVASRTIGRVPIARLTTAGTLLSLACAAVFLGFVHFGALGVTSTVVTMAIFSLGCGVAAPTALAQALSVDHGVAGSASGLYGFMQMTIAALCTTAAGLGGDPALSVGVVLLGAELLALVCFWIAR